MGDENGNKKCLKDVVLLWKENEFHESPPGEELTYLNSRKEDVARILYKTCLNNSIKYVRGSGYFRSSIFRLMTEDLLQFCIDGGSITLLTSTQWSSKDYEAAMEGYEKGIVEDLRQMLNDPETVKPTKMLCALIRNKKLDLRIAILRGDIYHQKKGYFIDSCGCIIAFDGSGNETLTALKPYDEGNAESYSIGWSWDEHSWPKYGAKWMKDLDQTLDPEYDSTYPVLRINDDSVADFIDQTDIDLNLESHREAAKKRQVMLRDKWDEIWGEETAGKKPKSKPVKEEIRLPEDLRVHQRKGVKSWKSNGCKGILEHATGSGKTITALSVIKEHVKSTKHAIVLVPSEPLLEQWGEEFDKYLKSVVVGFLGGGLHQEDILDDMAYSEEEEGFVLISTIQSFRDERILKKVKKLLNNNNQDILLVVDECHRIGANSYSEICSTKFDKALGLSATPKRQGDEDGTERLLTLLGPVVDTYTLQDALDDKHLCEFNYNIHSVSLTVKEQEDYDNLREKMKQALRMLKKGEPMSKYLQSLIFKSRHIIRGAEEKIPMAIEILKKEYENGQSWLIYCEGQSMLTELESLIADEIQVNPLIYWSGMNKFDRKKSLEWFGSHGGIMLAIKCLDEGVDVPSISHGIVLSSSKTEREWIQRRGRLLRKSPSKPMSHIFDVLALPSDSGEEVAFVLDEVIRAKKFSQSAKNKRTIVHEINKIVRDYDLNEEDIALAIEDESDE